MRLQINEKLYKHVWQFIYERMMIYWLRIAGVKGPWTNDSIFSQYKFTNIYRITDRTSQFLLKEVIYKSNDYNPEDIIFRILLFKIFNKEETWEALEAKFETISWKDYDVSAFSNALSEQKKKETIFSSAYIMGSTKFKGKVKHEEYLKLLAKMMDNGIANKILNAKSFREVLQILTAQESFGNFLSYQFTVDLLYSPVLNFHENDAILTGQGTRRGLQKLFFGLRNNADFGYALHWLVNNQKQEFLRYGIDFPALFGRELTLTDWANICCEYDKYSRVAFPKQNSLKKTNRQKIKQRYDYRKAKSVKLPFLPPKWNLNVDLNYVKQITNNNEGEEL